MPRTVRLLAGLAVSAALLTGCGEEPEVIDVGARIATATDALECPSGAEVETGSGSAEGVAVSADALGAVQAWAKRARRSADIPLDGYRADIEETGTVLFTHEADGRAEIAVITARTQDQDGGLGWVVESWARCRPAGTPSS